MYNYSNTLTRASTFTAVPLIIAGAVAAGPSSGPHHQVAGSPAAATYSLPGYDHADPQHSEPAGEFIRLANPESGTASTTRVTAIPG
jgi:hypothetical protein